MERIESNLENITRDNAIYGIRERILVDIFNEGKEYITPTDELEPETELSTILTDAYYLHYSLIPVIRTDENPSAILEAVRKGLFFYVGSRTYQQVRIKTELNDELSTYYAILLMKNLMSILTGAEGSHSGRAVGKRAVEKLKEVVNARKFEKLGMMIEDAAKQAADDLDKVSKVLGILKKPTGWGRREGDYLRTLRLADLVKRVKDADRILEFTNGLIAKMSKFFSKTKTESPFGTEIGGYKLTRNPLKAAPKELALPELLLLSKLVSQGLAAKRRLYVKPGALYVLIDKSGSMAGEKTIWSRSVALALLKRCQMEGRAFFLRFFDYRIYRLLRNPDEIMMDILSVKSNGGTDIQRAILTAVYDLKEMKLSRLTNTIIVITDGESRISKRLVRKSLEDANARLITIFIGENRDSENVKNLIEVSDKRFVVRPMEKDALAILPRIS